MKNKVIKALIILVLIFPIVVSARTIKKIELVKCIDGDTAIFKIGNEKEKVRFLAINTPEYNEEKKEYYGKEASEYTCKKLTNAKKIEIEYDKKSDKRDRYGRVLGWIFVDDTLLQESLVKNGYAEIKYVYDNYSYVEILEKREKQAKKKELGIWSGNKEKKELKEEKNGIFNYFKDIFKKIRKKILEK